MGDEPLAVTMARVEGKIDAYAARTTAVEEKVNALDERLRHQETRQFVTPAGLIATLATTVATLGGLVTFVQKIA